MRPRRTRCSTCSTGSGGRPRRAAPPTTNPTRTPGRRRGARRALPHSDRNPDAGLHGELAARGAFLGYDGPARARSAPDSVVLDCLHEVASAGHAHALLLGGDVARASRYASYGGMPGLAY